MARRTAFTLIELLVVISIIAILAGILVPTIVTIRHQSRIAESMNHMRQIGGGIEAYRLDEGVGGNDAIWPGRLGYLVQKGGVMEGLAKILIDPLDPSQGTDPLFGRHSSWYNTYVPDLYHNDPQGAKGKLSYFYEMSEEEIVDQNLLNWFYRDQISMEGKDAPTPGGSRPIDWRTAKIHQVNNSNVPESGAQRGNPFPKSRFPVVRSYNKRGWSGDDADHRYDDGVLNLSWNLEVFWSSTKWEHTVSPKNFPDP